MAKKMTEKQIAKAKAKLERENIISEYLKQIQDIIDQGYLDITESLEMFNKELEQSSVQYMNIETQIRTLLKAEDFDEIKINELLSQISQMEERNDDLYHTITSRDIKTNKLLMHLPDIAEKVANVIQLADNNLTNHKNKVYIVSLITNRSFDVFKSYNNYIANTALESNEYIDMYIDARENFLDFIEESKEELERRISVHEKELNSSEVIIEENIKYNQRLRVDYSELCNFLKYKGYECDRQGSTTHAVWKHIETGHSVPLPNKSGTIPQGTASKVLRQIGSNRNELAQYLYA